MRRIGFIKELWRYPVSSLAGELCQSLDTHEKGLAGDRQFGLFETATGSVAAPDKEPRWRPALLLTSRIDADGRTSIGFPDGAEIDIADHGLNARLSGHFGFEVSIGQYADQHPVKEHWLPVIGRSYAPSPLHLLTTSSIEALESNLASNEADRRRFRPSVLLQTEADSGFVENDWIGAILHIGSLRAIVIERTKRCGVTLAAQADLPEQPDVLRTILRSNHRCLGVYCDIIETGTLQLGQDVMIER